MIGNTDLNTACRPSSGRPPGGSSTMQELVVGRLLNLDEVRHLGDFLDFPEKLANALATSKCLRSSHVLSSPSNRLKGHGRLSGGPPSIATVRTGVRRRISRDPVAGQVAGRSAANVAPLGVYCGETGI